MKLVKGDKAPDFSAEINGGNKVSLNDFNGKTLVLYFYPKDNTSGCTKEACEFRDNMDLLANDNVEVLGVSPDSVSSHEKFIEKFNLNFNLVSDSDNSISTSYGAYGEKSMYGRKYMGIIRSSFLINKDGIIENSWYNVKVNGHVEAVKKSISEM